MLGTSVLNYLLHVRFRLNYLKTFPLISLQFHLHRFLCYNFDQEPKLSFFAKNLNFNFIFLLKSYFSLIYRWLILDISHAVSLKDQNTLIEVLYFKYFSNKNVNFYNKEKPYAHFYHRYISLFRVPKFICLFEILVEMAENPKK